MIERSSFWSFSSVPVWNVRKPLRPARPSTWGRDRMLIRHGTVAARQRPFRASPVTIASR
jgi:hypothetical protein